MYHSSYGQRIENDFNSHLNNFSLAESTVHQEGYDTIGTHSHARSNVGGMNSNSMNMESLNAREGNEIQHQELIGVVNKLNGLGFVKPLNFRNPSSQSIQNTIDA